MQQRVDLAISSFEAYSNGQVVAWNSGPASRVELWGASIRLLIDNPIVGVDPSRLHAELGKMHERGLLSAQALAESEAEMHSEIPARMAKYGGLGLLSALLVSLVPFWIFSQSLNSSDCIARGAARMGGVLVLGFFIFGLTVEVFNIKMVVAFYALSLALLYALLPSRN